MVFVVLLSQFKCRFTVDFCQSGVDMDATKAEILSLWDIARMISLN